MWILKSKIVKTKGWNFIGSFDNKETAEQEMKSLKKTSFSNVKFKIKEEK